MASYLEIKQLLKDILCIEMDMDETCDIIWPFSTYSGSDIRITFPNEVLKRAFDNMQSYTTDKLEMSTMTYRESALQLFRPSVRVFSEFNQ